MELFAQINRFKMATASLVFLASSNWIVQDDKIAMLAWLVVAWCLGALAASEIIMQIVGEEESDEA